MLEHMTGKNGVNCVVAERNRQTFGKVPLNIAPRYVCFCITDHVFRDIKRVSVLECL